MNDRFTPDQQANLDRILREGEELIKKREQEKEEEYERMVVNSKAALESMDTEIELLKKQITTFVGGDYWPKRLEKLVEERCELKAALQELHDDYQEECYYGY